MIFATPLVASIKTYEGVIFQSKLIKATILTCFSAIRIDINHVYSFKTVARKTSGATGAVGGCRGLKSDFLVKIMPEIEVFIKNSTIRTCRRHFYHFEGLTAHI